MLLYFPDIITLYWVKGRFIQYIRVIFMVPTTLLVPYLLPYSLTIYASVPAIAAARGVMFSDCPSRSCKSDISETP